MSIRAVDLAMPLQRATEMTSNQRGENRPDQQSQQFAARLNKEAEIQEQQVQQTPKGEEANIRKDGRGGNSYSGNAKKRKPKKEAVKSNIRQSTSMLDLTI